MIIKWAGEKVAFSLGARANTKKIQKLYIVLHGW